MLLDARAQASDSTVETDLCIIGAGAAGITLALELAGAPFRVCVLESGGFEPDSETQSLYAGPNVGRPYFPLEASRSRAFGGSTHCWHGMCRPLDAIDFEARAWVPHSGWPFARDELVPYYRRAQERCRLARFDYAGAGWELGSSQPLPLGDDVVTGVFQVAATRFGEVYRDEVLRAPNVRLLLHGNAVELEPDADVRSVARVRVATLGGNGFWLRSRFFVLATGGIENARLLLASNRRRPAGLGNQNDLVGRFFMEHPHVRAGSVLTWAAAGDLSLYRPQRRGRVVVLGCLAASAQTMRRERMQNFVCWLGREEQISGLGSALARTLSDVDGAGVAARRFLLVTECEQAPNPESRIVLARTRDRLGIPRAQLAWRLSPGDRRSARRGHEILARAFGRASLGRVEPGLDAEGSDWPVDLEGGRHHMGTTRMHEQPARGVVDANGCVHGLSNLYVAGSSVFPTAGAANPTLTVVALATRLAEHLKQVLA